MKMSTLHNFPEFDGVVPWDIILRVDYSFFSSNRKPVMSSPVNQQTLEWMAEREKSGSRHVVTVGEHQVVWRQFGSGSPLVLIHGGHGSWLHWARNIEALSKDFSLWIPNLAGYGDSSDPRFDDFPRWWMSRPSV